MSLKFWKLEGAGNDFIFFDFDPESKPELRSKIPSLCLRHFGIGADGVVFVFQKQGHWTWRFFNQDASETDFCGNAARCVGRFLKLVKGVTDNPVSFLSPLGRFDLNSPKGDGGPLALTWPQQFKERTVSEDLLIMMSGLNDHGLSYVKLFEVGVPHLVLVNHESWFSEHRVGSSRILRKHQDLGPEGANITWVSGRTLEVVTYERGVEAETMACGSGALAAFLTLEAKRLAENEPAPKSLDLKFPGGLLSVERVGSDQLALIGPAELVFSGEVAL